jgi:hypothetical protein
MHSNLNTCLSRIKVDWSFGCLFYESNLFILWNKWKVFILWMLTVLENKYITLRQWKKKQTERNGHDSYTTGFGLIYLNHRSPLHMSEFVLAQAFYWTENLSYVCIGILSFIHTVVENSWYKYSDIYKLILIGALQG